MPLLPVKCSAFKALLGALLLVAGLQLVYLSLLSGLHGRQQRRRYSQLFQGSEPRANRELEEARARRESLVQALEAGGTLDSSGQYRLYRDVTRSPVALRPGEAAPQPDLFLATHASVSNLHHLPALVRRWQAPLSLALFAPSGEVAEALLSLYRLSLHCPGVQELVTFTLVTCSQDPVAFPPEAASEERPDARDPELDLDAEPEPHPPCRRALAPLRRRRRGNYQLGGNASYPNNLLRNAARQALPARYVAVIDVDMLPSDQLYRHFLELVAGPGPDPGLTVFVLPALEMRHSRRLPALKPELQRLYQVGEVRPFYEELCPRCQAPTNYSRWINLPSGPGPSPSLGVAYTRPWTDPWEPFYVGLRSVPPYDERFKQYGFNRISQACELHVAGYTFAVLDNAFLVHKGFKLASEFHPRKDEENKQNKILFRQFKQELKAKYSESPRRC